MRTLRFLVFIVCFMIFCVPALGETAGGMDYDQYQLSYEQNVSFINNNTGRHMLPLLLSESIDESDGSTKFAVIGDTLSLDGDTDPSGMWIDTLTLRLSLPQPDLQPGTLLYSDFQTSGYHCYALLMAMDASETAPERYALVTRVESALKQALEGGSRGFLIQVGGYELTAERGEGTMTLSFVNSSLMTDIAPVPTDDGASPFVEEDDSGYQG